jgi:hypothetical protein
MLRMKTSSTEQVEDTQPAEPVAAQPSPAAAEQQDEQLAPATSGVGRLANVSRRRLGLKVGVVAVAVFAAVAYSGVHTDTPGSMSLNATAEAQGVVSPSSTVVAATLDADAAMRAKLLSLRTQALEFRAMAGSFDGFAAAGALVSSSTDTVTISLPEGNVCGFVAVFRGQQGEPQIDPSLSACSQQQIDEAGVAARVIDLVAAAFAWSANTVDVYGRRTLTGFGTSVAGVSLVGVSPDGAWAQAYVEHGSACVIVTVTPQNSPTDPLVPAEQVPCPPAG